ncbi:tetratricopeptide repeat protein [Aquimarina sp. D1M17]|uniref:tetratricopeptide repeat protein n=1 Tax=Aquimarina acroporae TaxID=2937283 RepID=UPI0020C0B04F|nr:tetratricopeptide repeat protein [Aquimarina acroporae]MCK8521796.1 tetratricopeptide repeat protein [Aquimarina acroporae]
MLVLIFTILGECYLKMNNTELALKNYKKSILINPENSNAKQVIEKIELEHKN